MFAVILFVIEKRNWKQINYQSMAALLNALQNSHTLEYYAILMKNIKLL